MAAPALARAGAIEEPIEQVIGETVAAAAAALAAGLQEHWQGGLSFKTKMSGGDWIAKLYELREATRGEIIDFDETAREWGSRALRARCNGGWSKAAAKSDILIDEILTILGQVTQTMRSTMN